VILVLAGTKDGRDIIELIASAGYKVMASVFSDYGRELIQVPGVDIHTGPLDADGFAHLIGAYTIDLVVDASHPYAVNVSHNAIMACQAKEIPYLRYERPTAPMPVYEGLHLVHGYQEAAQVAASLGNIIFLTTGSRHLHIFKAASCMQDHRLIARILPEPSVLTEALQLGFPPSDIVALQGPFSHQLNVALFKEYGAKVIVTKNSGQVGGSDTKITAAMELGLALVVIDRPTIEYPHIVYNIEDTIQFVKELTS